MTENTPIEQHIEEMRRLGEVLMPYNFPQSKTEDEDIVNVLKDRDVTVDGYDLTVCYSKSDYNDHYLENFQVFSRSSPFLPFHLVCKLAQRFLGDSHLSLVEIYRDNRKVYCWNVALDKKGRPVHQPYKETEAEECTFEGFRYTYMNPKTVNFY